MLSPSAMPNLLDGVSIKTPRLVLRPYTSSDALRLVELLDNWNVAKSLATLPHPYNQSDATGFMKRVEEGDARLGLPLAIEMDGELIGGLALSPPKNVHPVLGYWLGEPYWGRGIMSEAVGHFLESCRQSGVVPFIESGAFSFNPASLRILEKLGFVVTGESRKHCLARRAAFKHIDMQWTATE